MTPIADGIERRQINAALAAIREIPAQDARMIEWLQEFTQALRTNEPLEPIIERYRDRLLPLLQQFAGVAFQANEPLGYDNRPLRQLIDQLLDPRSILHTDEIEAAFGHMRREVLSERDQRIQRLMARNRQREQIVADEVRNIRQGFDALTDEIRGTFAALRIEDREVQQQQIDAVEQLRQNDEAQQAILQERIDALDAQIDALNAQNAQLEADLQSTNSRITATERSNAELKHAINEAEKAMKERQKDWLQVVLVIGASVVLSWAAKYVMDGVSFAVGSGMKGSSQPAFWARFTRPL